MKGPGEESLRPFHYSADLHIDHWSTIVTALEECIRLVPTDETEPHRRDEIMYKLTETHAALMKQLEEKGLVFVEDEEPVTPPEGV